MKVDLDNFRINCQTKSKPLRPKKFYVIEGGFINGPIPLEWLSPIMNRHGRFTRVALVVWHLFSLKKRPSSFRFSYAMARKFGLSRSSAWRGLKKLNEISAIEIKLQSHGSSPIISLNLGKPNE